MFICIFAVGSEKHMCHVKNASWPLEVSSRSSKVIDLGTNRKCVLGFLLVFNSNLGRILHRFGDMVPYRSKNRKNRPFEPTPLSQIALARGDPLRIFVRVVPRQRSISMGYQTVKKL